MNRSRRSTAISEGNSLQQNKQRNYRILRLMKKQKKSQSKKISTRKKEREILTRDSCFDGGLFEPNKTYLISSLLPNDTSVSLIAPGVTSFGGSSTRRLHVTLNLNDFGSKPLMICSERASKLTKSSIYR